MSRRLKETSDRGEAGRLCGALTWGDFWPGHLDTLVSQLDLEIGQLFFGVANGPRRRLELDRLSGCAAGGLTDVPFHGVQTVAAVRDVRYSDVFRCGQQVFDPLRDQGAERNLERQGADVDVVFATRAGVKIDAIAADAD